MKYFKFILRVSFLVLFACGAFWLFCSSKNLFLREQVARGRTMTEWLKILKANTNSPDFPLKIVRITSDYESRNVEVEAPMSYDSLVAYDFREKDGSWKNGKLDLCINDRVLSTYCERATNGNCIFGCDLNDFSLGTNQIRIEFFVFSQSFKEHTLRASGPLAEFVSSNICHINPYIHDTNFKGLVLHADLWASNAIYRIELSDASGNHVKTISGSTSNGIINERWNLTDDHGSVYPYNSVDAVYQVNIPGFLLQIKKQTYSIQLP